MSENTKGGLGHNGKLSEIIDKDYAQFDFHSSVEAARRVGFELHSDDLTGLLNKKTWRKKLDEALQQKGDKAVLFIDLTNFKRINDEDPQRHEAGDEVLRKVAGVLRKSFRLSENDSLAHERHYESSGEVGRIGGDEFAVLLDLTPREEDGANMEPSQRMEAVINRLHNEFGVLQTENPLLVQYGFDVAIGGAVWEEGMDTSMLLTLADHAMAAAKAEQHQTNGSYR